MFESYLKPPISFPTITGSIVTFNSQYAGLPLKSHTVAVTATQSGSGTPSPDNVRPITGYSAINISHSDADTSNPTVHTIQIGSTVYGGEYDARTGVLTVTHKHKDYPTINLTTIYNIQADGVRGNFTCPDDDINRGKWIVVSAPILSMFDGSKGLSEGGISKGYAANEYTVFVPNVTTKAAAEAALAGMQMVYTLANPILIQLPPCPIDTLEGVNNIWADTGDTTLQYIKFG